jgi:hypothetical protein
MFPCVCSGLGWNAAVKQNTSPRGRPARKVDAVLICTRCVGDAKDIHSDLRPCTRKVKKHSFGKFNRRDVLIATEN